MLAFLVDEHLSHPTIIDAIEDANTDLQILRRKLVCDLTVVGVIAIVVSGRRALFLVTLVVVVDLNEVLP